MKAIIKFFVYMGLISIILYMSGCFYHGSGENHEPFHKKDLTTETTLVTKAPGDSADAASALQNGRDNPIPADVADTVTVVLYFDNGDGFLAAERREIPKVAGIARQTVLELCQGPRNQNLLPTLPGQARLLDINIRDGLCTVNFSHHLQSNHSGGSSSENLTIYSIVNTLTQFSTINQVLILIEGTTVQSLAGHLDISVPLARDGDLIRSL